MTLVNKTQLQGKVSRMHWSGADSVGGGWRMEGTLCADLVEVASLWMACLVDASYKVSNQRGKALR